MDGYIPIEGWMDFKVKKANSYSSCYIKQI